MPFNMAVLKFFGATWEPGVAPTFTNATALRMLIEHYYSLLPSWAQPNFVLGNHDVHRVRTRVGKKDLAQALMMLLLTLRGTPTVYNGMFAYLPHALTQSVGDEFGQEDGYVGPGHRKDPNCLVDYNGTRCRDPERTPLQWDNSSSNAGFTAGNVTPWLPVSPNYKTTNVAQQLDDDMSFLALTRRLLALRQKEEALSAGSFEFVDVTVTQPTTEADHVLAYIRSGDERKFMTVINLGDVDVTVDAYSGFTGGSSGTMLVTSQGAGAKATEVDVAKLVLHARTAQLIELPVKDTGKITKKTAIIIGGSVAGFLVLSVIFYFVSESRRRKAGYSNLINAAPTTGYQ